MDAKRALFSSVTWTYYFHPENLNKALKTLAKNGYFQELTWLVYYLLWAKADEATRSQIIETKEKTFDFKNMSLEQVIWACVGVENSRPFWVQFLRGLPDVSSRRKATELRESLTKEIRNYRSKEHEAKKKIISTRIAEMEQDARFALLYRTVVSIFVNGIKDTFCVNFSFNFYLICYLKYNLSFETRRRCFGEDGASGCHGICW